MYSARNTYPGITPYPLPLARPPIRDLRPASHTVTHLLDNSLSGMPNGDPLDRPCVDLTVEFCYSVIVARPECQRRDSTQPPELFPGLWQLADTDQSREVILPTHEACALTEAIRLSRHPHRNAQIHSRSLSVASRMRRRVAKLTRGRCGSRTLPRRWTVSRQGLYTIVPTGGPWCCPPSSTVVRSVR